LVAAADKKLEPQENLTQIIEKDWWAYLSNQEEKPVCFNPDFALASVLRAENARKSSI
jgi:hypothetical protein